MARWRLKERFKSFPAPSRVIPTNERIHPVATHEDTLARVAGKLDEAAAIAVWRALQGFLDDPIDDAKNYAAVVIDISASDCGCQLTFDQKKQLELSLERLKLKKPETWMAVLNGLVRFEDLFHEMLPYSPFPEDYVVVEKMEGGLAVSAAPGLDPYIQAVRFLEARQPTEAVRFIVFEQGAALYVVPVPLSELARV
jgi:hypothetical protein